MLSTIYKRSFTPSHRAFSSQTDNIVQKIKEFFVFKPDSTSYETYANKGVVGKGYRYPSPSDRSENVFVPSEENEDDLYNTQYYTRDTTRLGTYNKPVVIFNRATEEKRAKMLAEGKNLDGTLIASGEEGEQKEPEDKGSPGNKNPAVLRYDPTGTRSAMTTTWEATEAAVKTHEPTHLPELHFDMNAVAEDAHSKGIPVPLGGTYTSVRQLDAKW